jgi:hypothetical protein
MVAFLVAAMVVTLMQFLRLRDRRLVSLLAVFTCLALGHSRDWWDPWKEHWQMIAIGAGLVHLLVLSRRPAPSPPAPPPPAAPPAAEPPVPPAA